MYKYVVDTQVFGQFMMPCVLQDIIDQDEFSISEDNFDKLYDALSSINELVVIDEDNDEMKVIEGGFSFQCISLSLKTIEKITFRYPQFFIEVVNLFKLNQYLNLDETLEEKQNSIKV